TPGVDLNYNGSSTFSSEVEIRVANYISNGSSISPRTCFFEQYLWSERPSFSIWPQPVSNGYVSVLPVEYQYYNFQDGRRFYATVVRFTDGVLSYDRIYLDTLLPDPASVPETHTGPVMPGQLRTIVLNEVQSTVRPQSFYSFSDGYDGEVMLFNVIDLTNTDNTLNNAGSDVTYFQNNPSQRKWRISCHFYNYGTGETWCFTADQFWDLLRQRVINLEIGESLEDAPSTSFNQDGWSAANNVLMHFFGRPNNHFHVPHDTWTFHGEDGDIYSWSRYYGNVRVTKSGIVGLESGDIVVPGVAALNGGVRPTIRYSQPTGETDTHRYLCVCEKLERLEPDEDLPQGQKEVLGIFVGTPFLESVWTELPLLDIDSDGEVWTLCHVRIAYHEYFGSSTDLSFEESIMLLGIVRRLFVDQETGEQIIQYYSAYLMYNGNGTERWALSGRYNINTIDPVYGERWSADMTLFGDTILSRKMS
ncbi:MAG: hypothetical protein D3910_22155, partial [Candidatus Electrothrix sp. ATG2]|nr:hypothetical protein [Candidatus Electrothrix sp. ATG2]